MLAVNHVVDALSHCLSPADSSWPHATLPFPPLPAACHMFSRPGASLPVTVAAAPRQRAVELGCCAGTGKPVEKEGVVLPAAHRVAECSPSDAPPQCDPGHGLDCQGLGRCEGEGHLGIPEGDKWFIVYTWLLCTQ